MFIGRKKEKAILQKALISNKAEMIAVIGRRRVGKTFLVRTVCQDRIIFDLTGLQYGSQKEQMIAFFDLFDELTDEPFEKPDNWLEGFLLLKKYLKPHLKTDKKLVLFFDELPWLATPESSFLRALAHFWNSWASMQNLVVVLCGSASSWIIQKVINDKGGLHNRVTTYLHLKPFTLGEVKEYLQAKQMRFNDYQITLMYMTFGGVPLYLEFIEKGKSAIQNISDICFQPTGLLRNEFSRLYPALFAHADNHIAIVKALSEKHKGLSRTELIKAAGVPNGSSTTRVLEELEQSDFIIAYHPFGKKKKDKLYRLIDEYSVFYLKFIEGNLYEGDNAFLLLSQSQSYKIWCGYAFESICMKHIPQIKKALGVSGVHTTTFSFLKKGTEAEKGLQIDMLMERADQIIHLFEMKFHNTEYRLGKDYATRIEERQRLFLQYAKTKKLVFNTLITPFGLQENDYSSIIDQVLKLEDLFEG